MARQRRKNRNRQQSNAVFSISLKSERETDHRTTKQRRQANVFREAGARRSAAETKESDSRVEFWNEQLVRVCTIRYDTRCYFNVRSKADISQLNLPHGTDN